MAVEIRKLDSKGRVILPRKDFTDVYLAEHNDIIVLGKSEADVLGAILILENSEKKKQISALREWETLLVEADMLDVTTEAIDEAVLETQQKKLIQLEDNDNE